MLKYSYYEFMEPKKAKYFLPVEYIQNIDRKWGTHSPHRTTGGRIIERLVGIIESWWLYLYGFGSVADTIQFEFIYVSYALYPLANHLLVGIVVLGIHP